MKLAEIDTFVEKETKKQEAGSWSHCNRTGSVGWPQVFINVSLTVVWRAGRCARISCKCHFNCWTTFEVSRGLHRPDHSTESQCSITKLTTQPWRVHEFLSISKTYHSLQQYFELERCLTHIKISFTFILFCQISVTNNNKLQIGGHFWPIFFSSDTRGPKKMKPNVFVDIKSILLM